MLVQCHAKAPLRKTIALAKVDASFLVYAAQRSTMTLTVPSKAMRLHQRYRCFFVIAA